MEVFKDTIKILYTSYVKTTSERAKLIDIFIAFNLVLAFIQFVYRRIFGDFSYNSFIGGIYCTIGMATLTSSLRMALDLKKKQVSDENLFLGYLISSLVLYLVAINYLG
jgi:oligosaccharyltransferase complex subunit epsilon